MRIGTSNVRCPRWLANLFRSPTRPTRRAQDRASRATFLGVDDGSALEDCDRVATDLDTRASAIRLARLATLGLNFGSGGMDS